MSQVIVTMRFPFRMQVAEGTTFQVRQSDGSIVHCTVTDYQVPKAAEDIHGSGIDDGLGTLLQSTVSVRFPNQLTDEILKRDYEIYKDSATAAVNELADAYRYVSRHASARPIEKSLQCTVMVTDDDGNPIPNVAMVEITDLAAPLAPRATLVPKAVEQIEKVLDGALRVEYERLLLLDADYFAMLGDVRHAIFNADTALQVFIDRAVVNTRYSGDGYYTKWDPGLDSVHGISPYGFKFQLQGQDTEVMEIVETIHIIRNTIAHEGRPIFRIEHLGTGWRTKSHYVENHEHRNGMAVGTVWARELVEMANGIVYELRRYLKKLPQT